ncbi:KH domain-containing protein [bacterium]|jgi:spoIIIJ-associated protein|nr:KH domain-containing protein [bacterium]
MEKSKKGIFGFFKSFQQPFSKEDDEQRNYALGKEKESDAPKSPAFEANSQISEEVFDFCQDKLSEILDLAGFKGTVKFLKCDGDKLYLGIENVDDIGRIIGKDGATLDAFQILLKRMVYRKFQQSVRIYVEAGDYRRRRKDQMKSQIMKQAKNVIEKGDTVELKPMRAADRKLVHMMFEGDDKISTFSTGEGRDRRVVLQRSEG